MQNPGAWNSLAPGVMKRNECKQSCIYTKLIPLTPVYSPICSAHGNLVKTLSVRAGDDEPIDWLLYYL